MILIIMRHGEAENFKEPDNTRTLTDYGKHQCEQSGLWLHHFLSEQNQDIKSLDLKATMQAQNDDNGRAQQFVKIDLAIVSPYLRTQQSYRALNKGIKVEQQITIDAITPMGNAEQAADLIHAYATDINPPKTLAVITHMPLVSLLADKVCSGFNAKYFDTADILVVDYNEQNAIGTQLAFYQDIDEKREVN